MHQLPEIRIKYSWLLHEKISKLFWEKYWQPKGRPFPTKEKAIERVETYRNAWQLVERKILVGMCDAFGLEFYQPVIDVAVAPLLPSISTPLITNMRYEPEQWVDLVTHELFHILLTDSKPKFDYDAWQKEHCVDMERTTRNHILVHAGMKHIYLDIHSDPDRLKRDMIESEQWEGYNEAWEVVEQRGYRDLIESSKRFYR